MMSRFQSLIPRTPGAIGFIAVAAVISMIAVAKLGAAIGDYLSAI